MLWSAKGRLAMVGEGAVRMWSEKRRKIAVRDNKKDCSRKTSVRGYAGLLPERSTAAERGSGRQFLVAGHRSEEGWADDEK